MMGCHSWLVNSGNPCWELRLKNRALSYLIKKYRLIFYTKRQQNLELVSAFSGYAATRKSGLNVCKGSAADDQITKISLLPVAAFE